VKNTVLPIILHRWRELLAFALLFRLIESLLFAPALALVGKILLGRTVLDSTAFLSFLLSPRGFLALSLAAVTALSIRLAEHAGLSAIFFGAFDGHTVSARQAFRLVWVNLLTFVRLSARFAGVALLTILPLLAVAGAFAAHLFARHDVNYYLKLRPPEFITAAIVIGIVALITAAILLYFFVRWRWVVQAVLFQGKAANQALTESTHLTSGLRWKLAGVLICLMLISLLLGLAALLLGDACMALVHGIMGDGMVWLALSFGLLLLLRTIINAACSWLSACLDAGVFTLIYRRRIAALGIQTSFPGITSVEAARRTPAWLPAALVFGLACRDHHLARSRWHPR
jgi:glycerophosphoryl diester phosphodiesterase